ncbi:hypothetical protein JRG66_14950 [Salinimicrobium tongyeongense]|uniref:Uncharacterized protein n=1 Tax=Salinimicrobium tongyeongense TaxID=2809707 RepID=A0ABY6NQM8_9FLAO|nr:hypothetical protein [Salinimicrobium tongyeongense]UZH55225.1 hypothetical protein JRG66_14950 [Salinimicrobium tongyeongense]
MKKLLSIALLTFLFTSNVEAQETLKRADEAACTQEAWDFGTHMAIMYGGTEYFWTNWYYENNCI